MPNTVSSADQCASAVSAALLTASADPQVPWQQQKKASPAMLLAATMNQQSQQHLFQHLCQHLLRLLPSRLTQQYLLHLFQTLLMPPQTVQPQVRDAVDKAGSCLFDSMSAAAAAAAS
jgi:hypothetical protein